MTTVSLPELFERMRNEGLGLTLEQYYLAVEALLSAPSLGLDINTSTVTYRILGRVWVKSQHDRMVFDRCISALTAIEAPSFASEEEPLDLEVKPKSLIFQAGILPILPGRAEIERKDGSDLTQKPLISPDVVRSVAKIPKEGDYFPVKIRDFQRAWRRVNSARVTRENRLNLDVPTTVADIARRGFFIEAYYEKKYKPAFDVLLLVDQSHSMLPFAPLTRRFIETMPEARLFYFDNVIKKRLYCDARCLEPIFFSSVLSSCRRDHTLVLILSDGGAARRQWSIDRIDQTEFLIKRLDQVCCRQAWINPYSRSRWSWTTAEDIAAFQYRYDSFQPFSFSSREFNACWDWLLEGELSSNPNEFLFYDDELEDAPETTDLLQAFSVLNQGKNLCLAELASFPLGLTPDLLYRIWERFLSGKNTASQGLPWTVVADFLLSGLCQLVDIELYEITPDYRQQLIRSYIDRKGQRGLDQISDFMLAYLDRQLSGNDRQSQDLNQARRWIALACTKPNQVAQELAKALNDSYLNGEHANIIRLGSLLDTLIELLGNEYRPLLMVARSYENKARGDVEGVRQSLQSIEQALGVTQNVAIASQLLELPLAWDIEFQTLEFEKVELIRAEDEEHSSIKTLGFQTVKVDSNGTIIERPDCTVRYFDEDIGDGVSIRMIAIPSGEFLMGSLEGQGDEEEWPQHRVQVPPFFMSESPITQLQWKTVIERGADGGMADLDLAPSRSKGNHRPVERVSWEDATAFCKGVSRLTQRPGYRLPTEAEWEYACRAGSSTDYSFGNELTKQLAHFRKDNTSEVKQYPGNAFGLYDMHGNVWEWCLDHWHDDYAGAPDDGGAWVAGGDSDRRILRGGSWLFNPWVCRSADRDGDVPGARFNSYGFRLVLSLPRGSFPSSL